MVADTIRHVKNIYHDFLSLFSQDNIYDSKIYPSNINYIKTIDENFVKYFLLIYSL
jgi:hypothetical protein